MRNKLERIAAREKSLELGYNCKTCITYPMCKAVLSNLITKRMNTKEQPNEKQFVIKLTSLVARNGILGNKCPIFKGMTLSEILEMFELEDEYDKCEIIQTNNRIRYGNNHM